MLRRRRKLAKDDLFVYFYHISCFHNVYDLHLLYLMVIDSSDGQHGSDPFAPAARRDQSHEPILALMTGI